MGSSPFLFRTHCCSNLCFNCRSWLPAHPALVQHSPASPDSFGHVRSPVMRTVNRCSVAVHKSVFIYLSRLSGSKTNYAPRTVQIICRANERMQLISAEVLGLRRSTTFICAVFEFSSGGHTSVKQIIWSLSNKKSVFVRCIYLSFRESSWSKPGIFVAIV